MQAIFSGIDNLPSGNLYHYFGANNITTIIVFALLLVFSFRYRVALIGGMSYMNNALIGKMQDVFSLDDEKAIGLLLVLADEMPEIVAAIALFKLGKPIIAITGIIGCHILNDLHAIVSPFDAKKLHDSIKDNVYLYVAAGVDPKKTLLFVQSHVAQHTELAHVLLCHTNVGELSRMTQYKDKTSQLKSPNKTEIAPTGLLTYPTLMASDILLYDADFVPTGSDQKQHLELTRTIASRMNSKYGKELFKVPETMIPKLGARIMDLQNPLKKMSKSSLTSAGTIFLLDPIEKARKKIMSAVTDSENKIIFDKEKKPGISNLLEILSSLNNEPIKSIEKRFNEKSYKDLKVEVAEVVTTLLEKIQKRYRELSESAALIPQILTNAARARQTAQRKLDQVYAQIGLKFYLHDGTHQNPVQIVIKQDADGFEESKSLRTGGSVSVTGKVIVTKDKKQPFEIIAQKVEVLKNSPIDYPLQKKEHSLEFLRDIAHLRPRTAKFNAIFRIRSELSFAIHEFFHDHGFIQLHAPVITSNDAEGAGESFEVKSEGKQDFFGQKSLLSVSGQLTAEAYAQAFHHCAIELEFLSSETNNLVNLLQEIIKNDFAKITYSEAIEIINKVSSDKFKFEKPSLHFGDDLASEHERYLAEVHFQKPVFVTDYPKQIKAFYMKANPDGQTVAACDLLVPGVGEIVGGSQREDDYESLIATCQQKGIDHIQLNWYLEMRTGIAVLILALLAMALGLMQAVSG
ncbi:unnamed protein product [Didymodactylos carnosus]|uniref:tryptophan--tRNA ligase n=1 Tax=Didymodactylos carnosus TaxID=1234261 RepID=A0A8S2D3M9_9BILA|nr:unnamed protein product [Didymodactylos carnosus]CAF3588702.1 unnamed protein product [Didymodactylos carnosus]